MHIDGLCILLKTLQFYFFCGLLIFMLVLRSRADRELLMTYLTNPYGEEESLLEIWLGVIEEYWSVGAGP